MHVFVLRERELLDIVERACGRKEKVVCGERGAGGEKSYSEYLIARDQAPCQDLPHSDGSSPVIPGQ